MAVHLRRFIPYAPEKLLEGPVGDWIIIILLCGLFIAIAGAVLPKRLTENRAGKALTIFIGLILGIGLYMAKGIYNFNFESFGFLGIWLIVVLCGMVTFGLFKFGMRPDIAFALTYCVIFLSFSLITPSLFDSIAESFPFLNLIFFGTFFYLLGFILLKIFFRKKTVENESRALKQESIDPTDRPEIDREINTEKKEKNNLKRKTLKLTKQEINNIDDIDKLLNDIIIHLKKHRTLSRDDLQELSDIIRKISGKRNDFENGLLLLRKHTDAYTNGDYLMIQKLEERLGKTDDPYKKEKIIKEIKAAEHKKRIYDFMKHYESKIKKFLQSFEALLVHAINMIRHNNIPEALNHVKSAKNLLGTMSDTLKRLKHYEKELLAFTKQEEKILKKEEQGK